MSPLSNPITTPVLTMPVVPKQEAIPPRQEVLKLKVDEGNRYITNNYGLIDMKGTFNLMA